MDNIRFTNQSQYGQALPVGIAMCLVLSLIAFVLFNTGQTVSTKTRLANTADSAAYSGLLWQARALNFQAYTNRAMIANQVAMAQAVSLSSWSAYMSKTGKNLNAAFGWIPYVGSVTRIVEQVGESIDTVLNPISKGMLSVVNAVNASLSVAQEAMYYSAFQATPDIVRNVVISNDVDDQGYRWDTAFSMINAGVNLEQWNEFTESSEENLELAENERFHMINASIDKFSSERNWKFFNFFIPVTPLHWVRFEKAGDTQFHRKDGQYEWLAKDALSLRQKRYTWRGKRYRDLPVSGGSSIANSENTEGSILGTDLKYFEGRHATAQKRSNSATSGLFHIKQTMNNYDGIHVYRSISKTTRELEEEPVIKLKIQVSLDSNSINDSDELVKGGRFKSGIETPGDVMSSLSTAELYFKKPCFEGECAVEFANGYSPYWDVRLSKISGLSRMTSHTLQDGVIEDSMQNRHASLSRLPIYKKELANPITDYKEQSKGVKAVIGGMESHLASMVKDTDEYIAYQAKLTRIKANITFELDEIADQFVQDNLSQNEVIEAVAKAAGYDFNVDEFKSVRENVQEIYAELDSLRDLSLAGLESNISDRVGDEFEELRDSVKDELTEILEDSVKNIMAGMISSFIEQKAGINEYAEITKVATEDLARDTIQRASDAIGQTQNKNKDIKVNLFDECDMYKTVLDSELEVALLQEKLEKVNQSIAEQFHQELLVVTDASIIRREDIATEVEVLRAEIKYLMGVDQDMASLIDEKRKKIIALELVDKNIPNDRLERLTNRFIEISDTQTATVFPGFGLNYEFARKAVKEVLGDINVLELDNNGDTSENISFFSDASDELASDAIQEYISKPEGC